MWGLIRIYQTRPTVLTSDKVAVMPDKQRTAKEEAEYFTQPADGVKLVRRDLSQAELRAARQRIKDGESLDSVVNDFAAKILDR